MFADTKYILCVLSPVMSSFKDGYHYGSQSRWWSACLNSHIRGRITFRGKCELTYLSLSFCPLMQSRSTFNISFSFRASDKTILCSRSESRRICKSFRRAFLRLRRQRWNMEHWFKNVSRLSGSSLTEYSKDVDNAWIFNTTSWYVGGQSLYTYAF